MIAKKGRGSGETWKRLPFGKIKHKGKKQLLEVDGISPWKLPVPWVQPGWYFHESSNSKLMAFGWGSDRFILVQSSMYSTCSVSRSHMNERALFVGVSEGEDVIASLSDIDIVAQILNQCLCTHAPACRLPNITSKQPTQVERPTVLHSKSSSNNNGPRMILFHTFAPSCSRLTPPVPSGGGCGINFLA